MFPALRSEVDERYEVILQFFNATQKLLPNEAVVAKGLVFVQIYAVYEDTIKRVVSEAIEAVKVHRPRLVDMQPSLLALYLDPEFQSLRDVSRSDEWDRRIQLMERAFSRRVADLASETRAPSDGSHYRTTHLNLIFRVFGIKRLPVPRRRHMQRITEVVDHRNAIAHGNETPEDIGRRYTPAEIRTAIRQMRGVCRLWVRVFHKYCEDKQKHLR